MNARSNQVYISIIKNVMEKHHLDVLYLDEGFENRRQMYHFKYHGKVVTFIGVKLPEDSTNLVAIVDCENERWEINLNHDLTSTKVFQRIANDVYDWLRSGNEDEFYFVEQRLLTMAKKLKPLI